MKHDIMNHRIGDLLSERSAIPAVERTTSLRLVIARMKQFGVSSLVVRTDTGKLCGIISEHNVVQALAESGTEALAYHADAVMDLDLICCAEGDSLSDVMAIMAEERLKYVPIVSKEGMLLAFVSVLDILQIASKTK